MLTHLLKYKIYYLGVAIVLGLIAIWVFVNHEKNETVEEKNKTFDDTSSSDSKSIDSNKSTVATTVQGSQTGHPIEMPTSSVRLASPQTNTALANDDFPLKLGSKGERVVALQTWLMNVGRAKLSNGADGVFGSETEAALKHFKQRDNISQDYWNKIGIGKM